jgi:hypothetical protein
MRRMEQMLHRCHPGDLIKKVEQKCDCPFVFPFVFYLSDQCFKTFTLKQVEQLLRWAAGVLNTQFPLAHSGRAGVEQ